MIPKVPLLYVVKPVQTRIQTNPQMRTYHGMYTWYVLHCPSPIGLEVRLTANERR